MKSLLVAFYALGYLALWVLFIIGAIILFCYHSIEFIAESFWDAVLDDSRRVIEHPLDESEERLRGDI